MDRLALTSFPKFRNSRSLRSRIRQQARRAFLKLKRVFSCSGLRRLRARFHFWRHRVPRRTSVTFPDDDPVHYAPGYYGAYDEERPLGWESSAGSVDSDGHDPSWLVFPPDRWCSSPEDYDLDAQEWLFSREEIEAADYLSGTSSVGEQEQIDIQWRAFWAEQTQGLNLNVDR